MNYKEIITVESGKRGGKPCIRGMRITVYDILKMLTLSRVFLTRRNFSTQRHQILDRGNDFGSFCYKILDQGKKNIPF